MYLKALEIQGFKSFPDKTVLRFDAEVIAIVGPNGSGKSNIADAIRWVMGEQSAKGLRGTKMEDVIFSGTAKRSQVGFAQVTMVLDNTDGLFPAIAEREVAVARRYYRSGESEYYINRKTARLKDVTELLMDTGMGREGYSIISQGRIDAILAAKSGERRELFEEAAGIAKFRRRKEETERRLERTDADLVRIGDKIAELELQVNPLRIQSETAKRFLILRDELRVLEISLWMDALDTLKANSRKLDMELRAVREQRDGTRSAMEALFAAAEACSQRIQQKDMEAEEVRRTMSALDGQISELKSAAAVLESTASHNRENLERAARELSDQDNRAGGIRRQIAEQSERILQIDHTRSEIQTALDELLIQAEETGAKAGNAQADADALHIRETMALSAAAEARAALSGAESEQTQLLRRQTALDADLTDRRSQLEHVSKQEQELNAALNAAQREVSAAANRAAGYLLRLDSRQKRAAAALEEKNRRTMERVTADNQRRLLEEMEKSYEGFSRAVRSVMEARLSGIRGPVGSLMSTDAAFTAAIEIALGAGLQNIVVEREEDAKTAIGYLKRRDAGRATFLPLTAIQGQELHESGLEQESGYVGLASQLIKFDSEYTQIFVNLLGRTVIVETLDYAIAIARRYGRRFRIVTLDGQVVNRGGSMTGGSISRNGGILSRSAELRRLNGQLSLLRRQEEESVRAEETAKRELAAAQYDLETANGQRRQAEDSVLRLEGQQNHYKSLMQSLEQDIRALRTEQAELSSHMEASRKRAETLQAQAAEQERSAAEYHARAEERLSGQRELLELSSTLSESIMEKKSRLAALTAEQETIQSSLTDLQSLCEELSGDRNRQKKLLEQYQANIAAAENAREQKLTAIQTLQSQTAACQEKLTILNQEKLSLETERTVKNRDGQSMNDKLLDLERSLSEWKQKQSAAAVEEKQILDRLWERYELSHSDAQAQRIELESVQKATRRVAALKRDIAALGTPNLGAIDEFERVNSRYTYLTEQRDDVARAKKELEGVINEITSEMTTVFARQFALLAKTFQETFTDLFGGGHATLELEDKENILECGIEIKAQPPGKSLRTISLLSGGEKAFVAIALYFAILKVHPTPFCVMDEIEAALDDSNVTRFAKYLRRISGQTQCIVITHRRGTMEEADILYGVTMQEQGVSKMLTINLNEMANEMWDENGQKRR